MFLRGLFCPEIESEFNCILMESEGGILMASAHYFLFDNESSVDKNVVESFIVRKHLVTCHCCGNVRKTDSLFACGSCNKVIISIRVKRLFLYTAVAIFRI